MKCEHPDHKDGTSCLDTGVGCDAECFCCMGVMAVFNYLALIGPEVSDKARLSNAIGGLIKLIDELAELRSFREYWESKSFDE
jgi:hypothetical protein